MKNQLLHVYAAHTVLLFSCCSVQTIDSAKIRRLNGTKCCSYEIKVLVKLFSLTVWWLTGWLAQNWWCATHFQSPSVAAHLSHIFSLFVIICYPMCIQFFRTVPRIHMNSLLLLSVHLLYLFVCLLAWLVSFSRDMCVHETFFFSVSLCKSVCYSFNHSLNLKSKRTFAFLHTLNHLAWILFRAVDVCVFFYPTKPKYTNNNNLHFHFTHYILNTGFLCVFFRFAFK